MGGGLLPRPPQGARAARCWPASPPPAPRASLHLPRLASDGRALAGCSPWWRARCRRWARSCGRCARALRGLRGLRAAPARPPGRARPGLTPASCAGGGRRRGRRMALAACCAALTRAAARDPACVRAVSFLCAACDAAPPAGGVGGARSAAPHGAHPQQLGGHTHGTRARAHAGTCPSGAPSLLRSPPLPRAPAHMPPLLFRGRVA